MSDETKTPGSICWNEIITPDQTGSIEFYSQLMGWTPDTMEMPGGLTYTMFKQGEEMIAGCVQPPEAGAPPMWLSYVLVEDLDATVAKAQALGATVIKERIDIPMGSFVIITDPQGAALAFWQSSGQEC